MKRHRVFYGWYIVGASFLLNAYIATAFAYGFQVFFLPLIREFGWTRTATSGAFSLRSVESGFAAPLMGILVDRIGARPVILVSVVIAGAGMFLMSVINSLLMFYIALMIISLGMSGGSHGVTWTSVIAKWFRRLRGRATGLAVMGPMIGGPLVVLVALLEEELGWRAALRVLGVGFWVIGVPTALVARSRPQDYGQLPDGDLPENAAGPAPPEGIRTTAPESLDRSVDEGFSAREVLRTKVFWSIALILGIHGLGQSGLLVHQVALFQSRGYTAAEAASTVAVLTALSGVGRFAGGALMDKLEWQWVVVGVLGGQVAGLGVLVIATSYWQALASMALLGIAFGAAISLRPLLVGVLFGTRAFGSVLGLLQSASIATGVLGPIILGGVFDRYDTYTPALIGFSVLSAAVIPFTFITGRHGPRFAGPRAA